MDYTIEFNYISPLINLKFDDKNVYILIVSQSDSTNIYIHKIIINKLNNVTDTVRGYLINRSVQLKPSNVGTIINVNLYCHNIADNTIQLIGLTKIDLEKYEYNNKSIIHMTVPNNVNNFRTTKYDNDTVFLNEYFHDIENMIDNNHYLLFFRLMTPNKNNKFTFPTIIPYTDNKLNVVYNRYVNNICKESNNIKYIDKNLYNEKQLKLSYRPLQIDKYINSIITGICDGRYKGLEIQDSRIRMHGYASNLKLSHYVNNETIYQELSNGSGYYIKSLQQDYKGIFAPYAGHLVDFNIKPNGITLLVENDYYISPYTHERAYLSVINGNPTSQQSGVGGNDERYDPDILKIQNNGKLLYCLHVSFPKGKVIYKKKLGIDQWIEQGTELFYIDNSNSNSNNNETNNVLFFVNRPIDFVNDIKTFNKYQLMTYIRCRDIIGILN